MLRSLHLRLIAACAVAIFLAGCLGVPQGTGHITGRIVDEEGRGVYGITVTTDVHGTSARTDEDGRYTLMDVRAGRRRIVVSEPLGHTAGKMNAKRASGITAFNLDWDDPTWSATARNEAVVEALQTASETIRPVTVTVIADQTVSADTVMLYRTQATVSNARVHVIDPSITTPMRAGTMVSVDLGVSYTLAAEDALLIVSVGYPNALVQADAAVVSRGSGILSFTLQFEVPHTEQLIFQTALINRQDIAIAVNENRGHPVIGIMEPEAPTLQFVAADASGVEMQWTGGRPINFGKYLIYRDEYEGVNSRFGTLVGDIRQKDANTFNDTDVEYGKTYYYKLYMEALDGQVYPDAAFIQAPTMPVTHTLVHTAIRTMTQLIMDPWRDRFYLVSNARIGIVSASTGIAQAGFELGCRARHGTLTSDGLYLFFTCHEDMVARIDLNSPTPTIDYVTDIAAPFGIAADGSGQYAYVSSSATPDITILDMNDPSNRQTVAIDVDTATLALTPDDSILIVSGREYDGIGYPWSTFAYNTADLTLIHAWPAGAYGSMDPNFLSIHPTRDEVYVGQRVFDLQSGRRVQQLTAYAHVPSQVGDYIFATPLRFGQYMTVLRWDGLAWTEHLNIPLKVYPRLMAVSPDETKVFVTNASGDLWMVDLSELDY